VLCSEESKVTHNGKQRETQKGICTAAEVLAAGGIKISDFLDITPRSPSKVNRRFAGRYGFHFQGRRIYERRNRRESRWKVEIYSYLLHVAFLPGLFLDPEDGCDMFLRN
jgi:hypothetical protein